MSFETTRFGNGIRRESARPIKVMVGTDGEYWLCDADVAKGGDFEGQGCLAHSSVPMAEGG